MLFIAGVIIGLILGLTGAGGSLFAVPLLGAFLDAPMVELTGISLGAVAVSAMLGVIQRRTVGIVWLPVSVILITGVLLAPVGRWLAGYLSQTILLCGFTLLVLWVALRMWREALKEPDTTREVRAAGEVTELARTPQPLLINGFWPSPILLKSLAGGAITGLLSGLLGVGGGFVIVPLLRLIVRLNMQQAILSSLLVISFVSSSGFVTHWWLHGGIDLHLLALVAAGGCLGMVLGSLLGKRLAGPRLQQVFALMLLATTVLLWTR